MTSTDWSILIPDLGIFLLAAAAWLRASTAKRAATAAQSAAQAASARAAGRENYNPQPAPPAASPSTEAGS